MMQYPKKTLSALSLALLSACATQGDIQPAQQRLDAQAWGLADGASPADAAAQEGWWQGLGDPVLSDLITRALAAQPSLQVVAARATRAAAQAEAQHGAELPNVQLAAEIDRQHFTENGLVPWPVAGTMRNTGTLQIEGSWELDVFGRQRALVDAAMGQSRAAQADMQAARVLLSAQVARTYVQLARQLAQKGVLERTLAQRQEILELVRQRVKAGLDTTVELKQGEGALPEIRQQIEATNEQIAWSRHALAALSAQQPSATATLSPSMQAIQGLALPQTMPVDLLARRADIVAARWRVEASGHAVDSARAQFYPNIDLTGYIGFNAIGLDRWLDFGSRQYGVMPAIHLPLFDGDRRRANLRGNVADQDASIASYNQTVIDAVRDVVDQLSSIDSLARQRQQQAEAQGSAEAAYELAKQRYRAGLGTYLTVLSAESAVLNQRRLMVDLQARTLDTQVALVRALGGQLAERAATTTSHLSTPHLNNAKQSGDRS